MKKTYKTIGIIIIVLFSVVSLGLYLKEWEKNRMYVLLPVSEPENLVLNEKYWFSAKQWLADEENYLKVSGSYLIYKKGIKMPNINQELYHTFLREKELTQEKLPYAEFIKEMGSTLHGVYLHSQFDKDTLKPNDHFFLATFKLKNHSYETMILWEMDKKHIMALGIDEVGAYDRMYDTYTYSDYLKGKPVPKVYDGLKL